MQLSEIELSDSYTLDLASLSPKERKIWDGLPEDYCAFLTRNNGGSVEGEEVWFPIEITKVYADGKKSTSKNNCVEEFWAFLSYENAQPIEGKSVSILHEHFDSHAPAEFLPYDVLVIGICMQNSLIAISLNEHDYGAIYYWEWYWRYPWYKDFFGSRIEQAKARFEDLDAILDDPNHPQYREAVNALNYATLIKVADSFSHFIELCRFLEEE